MHERSQTINVSRENPGPIVASERLGSFSPAGECLGQRHPAVSGQIERPQILAGFPVLERVTRRVTQRERGVSSLRARPSFALCRRGVSAVEFAIIAPVLMILLFGILCYGMYFGMLHSVQQIAAEAARASVGGLSDTERVGLAQANIAVTAPSYPFVDAARLTVTSAVTDARTNSFSLTLSYDASNMPIFQLPAFVPLPAAKIQRSAVVMRGGL